MLSVEAIDWKEEIKTKEKQKLTLVGSVVKLLVNFTQQGNRSFRPGTSNNCAFKPWGPSPS